MPKRSVIITGFSPASPKKLDAMHELNQFFKQHLNIDTFVEDFYTLGGTTGKETKDAIPTVVSFQTLLEKKRDFRG